MKSIGIEIKWGIAFTLMSLAWMFFERSMGWHGEHISQHATMTNFFAIPAILLYVFALRDVKYSTYDGSMTFWQSFKSGGILSIVVMILSPLGQWITHTWITPVYFPTVRNYSVEQGLMSMQEAESYFSLSNYLLQSAVGALIMGIITTAIVSLFLKSSWK